MSKIVARLNQLKELQISGELDETIIGDMSIDQNGNIKGKELIEGKEEVVKIATTKEDFDLGTLTNMRTDISGYITVNQSLGSTTSILEDFEDTTYNFTFTGDWARDTSQKYAGVASWKAKTLTPVSRTHQQSTTQITVTVPSGAVNPKISFYYKVSSELNYDWFYCYVNDMTTEVLKKSGEVAWTYVEFPLVVGSNTIKWVYDIDGATSGGSNTSWIDNLNLSYATNGTQSTGNRISPNIDVSTLATPISGSSIIWNADVPTGTSLVVETSASTDNGVTWGSWVAQTNNSSIASLSGITSASQLQIRNRITMTTNSDSSLAPKLYDTTINIFGDSYFQIGQTELKVAELEEGVTLT